jgi:hypothetical protein
MTKQAPRASEGRAIGGWLSVVATIIAFFGLIFGGVQSCVTRQTLKEMQAEQRPWVYLKALSTYKDGPNWGFDYTISNVGKLPSRGLYIGSKLHDVAKGAWIPIADAVCDRGRQQSVRHPEVFSLFSVFPNDELTLRDRDTKGELEAQPERAKNMSTPHIVGCVVYKIDSDDDLHTTLFSVPLKADKGGKFIAAKVYANRPR